jgi:hypothetical protein
MTAPASRAGTAPTLTSLSPPIPGATAMSTASPAITICPSAYVLSEETAAKEDSAMTRILHPGNDRGFVFIDALLCLFIAVFILLLLSGSLYSVFRLSVKQYEVGIHILEEKNRLAQERVIP